MRCPACGERVRKSKVMDSAVIFISCRTDGDFVITPGALKKLDDFDLDARQQALNRAILIKHPSELPRIRKFMIEKRVGGAGIDATHCDRRLSQSLDPTVIRVSRYEGHSSGASILRRGNHRNRMTTHLLPG